MRPFSPCLIMPYREHIPAKDLIGVFKEGAGPVVIERARNSSPPIDLTGWFLHPYSSRWLDLAKFNARVTGPGALVRGN